MLQPFLLLSYIIADISAIILNNCRIFKNYLLVYYFFILLLFVIYHDFPFCSIPANIGVLVLVKFGHDSFTVRVHFDSSVDMLRKNVCGKWPDLTSQLFDLYYSRDGVRRNIETNSDLQSILLLSAHNCEVCLVLFVDVVPSASSANNAGSIRSDAVTCTSDSSFASSGDSSIRFRQLLRNDSDRTVFFGVGQQFPGGVTEFRLHLMIYSIKNGYKLDLIKNDRERVTAVCSRSKCKFRIHASLKFNLPGYFVIKRFQPEHSCGAGILDINDPPVSSKLIKLLVFDHIQANPLMKTKDIVNLFQTEYGIILKYYFAYSGKRLALEDLHGSDMMSYHHLKSFCDAVIETNPGSKVVLEQNSSTRQFERVFIGFEACAYGFQFCRPLIFVDATFMKGRAQGCLMAATGKNGNEGMLCG